jgi:hypothetical protein
MVSHAHKEDEMGTIRTSATAAAAALIVASILAHTPAAAEPLVVASPTRTLAAQPLATGKVQRTAQPRTSARAAPRRVQPPATGSNGDDAGYVMRGPNTISLIARLPWWRSPDMQTIQYRDKEYVSQVLSAADAWFVATTGETDVVRSDGVVVASADDLNEIDLADGAAFAAHDFGQTDMAAAFIPESNEQSWLHALLALLGGALAAVSAARFLFV